MKKLVLLFILLLPFVVEAQEEKAKMKPIPEPKVSTTDQSVEIKGKTIALTAHAGTMQLRDENNEPIANSSADKTIQQRTPD